MQMQPDVNMPAKGSKRKHQNRKNLLTIELWKRYVEETGDQISREEFYTEVRTLFKNVATTILDNELGFRIPSKMGYWAITKYKTPENFIDMVHFRKTGERRPLLNLHSLGKTARLVWYNYNHIAQFMHSRLYVFSTCKEMRKLLQLKIEDGMEYEDLKHGEVFMTDKALQRFIEKQPYGTH
jgi:hypothetical protein